MSIKFLQDYTFKSKYANWSKDKQRRENWKEAVTRSKNMMLAKYKDYDIEKYIHQAYKAMERKEVLGSQRAFQFAGDAVFKHNARSYNCCASYCDRPRFFQECMYLLLCGCGTGFSVQTHHIDKLPNIIAKNGKTKTFVIEDSIEGWSDSIGVLVNSYFDSGEWSEYTGCPIKFDYSKIRDKGADISSCSGKAPGPEPLKNSHAKIKALLDRCIANGQTRLRPIDAYDIVMHSSDAVLAGGIRRSATICIFSLHDNEMMTAKTGNWFYDNPQRGRSNNSVALLKDSTTKNQFLSILKQTREFGEPGFIWMDNSEHVCNPCVTEDTVVATSTGLKTVKELINVPFKAMVNGQLHDSDGFFFTGNKEVLELVFASGRKIKVTPNHQIMTTDGWVEAKDLDTHQVVIHNHNIDTIINRTSEDYLGGYAVGHFVALDEIHDFRYGSTDYLAGIVNGFFDAECVAQSELSVLEKIQIVLNYFGINSNIKDDPYLSICSDSLDKFLQLVTAKSNITRAQDHQIIDHVVSKNNIGYHNVYDCTVPEISAFDANGIYVHNCVEISFFCYDEFGNSGWQMCNLSTQNGAKIKTVKDFFRATKNATIIGTLQAGFTEFKYLGEVSENITRREALLGVSMTGIMDAPDVCLDPKLQQRAARIAKKINARIAKLININQSARITCVKPEGSTSCVLGTSSGIHPHHSKRYIRRVQANTLEPIYQYFKSFNPQACEKSAWSNNGTDDVIAFPIEIPSGSKTKYQISAIDLLKLVKSTQENWVNGGKNTELCSRDWLQHNVSNTITVCENEWDAVGDFIYENRSYFCGISLLPSTGDKDFKQAPFSTVHSPTELVTMYGEAAIMASGLIEQAKILFEDDLWLACDTLMGLIPYKGKAKGEWIDKCVKFANKYLHDDVKKLSYCLKDVDTLKLFTDLKNTVVEVDYDECLENQNNVQLQDLNACAGGACTI